MNTDDQKILHGGSTVNVQHADGTQEPAKVRLLKIAEFPDYFRLVDNEEALAEFLCGKEAGWASQLTVESLLEVCETGHDVNFRNACRWGQRRAMINEALLPIAASGQAVAQQFPQLQGEAGRTVEPQPRNQIKR